MCSWVACCRSRFAWLSVGVVVLAALSSSCAFVSLYLCCGVVLVNLVRPCPMYFLVASWLEVRFVQVVPWLKRRGMV
jgi:hypothetical protein